MRKLKVLLFSLVLALGFGVTVHAADKSDCSHKWSKWKTIVKSTCEATGIKQRTCSKCKFTEEADIKAKGHKYPKKWTKADKKASCVVKGNKYKKCKTCGYINVKGDDDGSDLKHKFSKWKLNKNRGKKPCTDVWEYTRKCSKCGYKDSTDNYLSTIRERKADLDTGEFARTNIEEALKDEKITDSMVKKICTDSHKYSSWALYKKRNCAKGKGAVYARKCKTCGSTQRTTDEEFANCKTVADYKAFKLTDTQAEQVLASGHTYKVWVKDAEATCTEDAKWHIICSYCGQPYGGFIKDEKTQRDIPKRYTTAQAKSLCDTLNIPVQDTLNDPKNSVLGHNWSEQGGKHCIRCGIRG